MERLNSIAEFYNLAGLIAADRKPDQPVIIINAGTCGQASGANGLIRVAKAELLRRHLTDKITLRITGCHGFCEQEPSVLIEPTGTFYPKVNLDDMPRIVAAVEKGEVLAHLLYEDPNTGEKIEKQRDIPFFKKQVRTLLSQNEKVDPIRIYDYIDSGGYSSLVRVLEKGDPQWVIDEIKESGLRGRGGAGFPAGLKWEMLAKAPGDKGKYIVCNADEGDPGAYMDRSLLEGNPHSIIEAMLIGAYATGATKGVIYVRAEYPLAIKHLVIALRQAKDLGLIGENILGSGFSFDIEYVKGAGAFVCGEETALMHSIEGKMGEPRQRPPYPVQKGINGCPTLINNVETWANIPVIIRHGAKAFSAVGTPKNTGTKIFSLVGKIRNTGLVEVPMGIRLEEILYDIGGGSSTPSPIKAIQTGGPSGGCIPASRFNLTVDYDSLNAAGTIMGSGGMIVMDENTCVVDIAKYFMNFLKDESCGKCFTCRKGTQRMWEILDDITNGKGTMDQLALLEELALAVKDTTMCGLGQSASNPVLSTLRYYREEYEQHILDKKCVAYACKPLVGAPCQTACPLGTEAWRYTADILAGDYKAAYRVIREANPFPSVCARVCNHPCESKCRAGTSGGDPIAIRTLKRFVTDHVDADAWQPYRIETDKPEKIAIVGAGPAGLTAAHYLSLKGYQSTIYEAMDRPGGMMVSAIPEFRLPREVLDREIISILNDDNITLKTEQVLGRDFTVQSLLDDGFKSVFIATGAPKSKKLGIEGEDATGVYSSMTFLRAFNLFGRNLAQGRVGIIGGGNSAIDAARAAIRQPEVQSVTIIYRRTRDEMPAFSEEIEGGLEEGIELFELTSPVKIITKEGKISELRCLKNELGERDQSGRRKPVVVDGSEFSLPLDTLIIAISEETDSAVLGSTLLATTEWGTLVADPDTLATSQAGIFAGGDVVTGPNSVVDAIAAGKKAAVMIDRYIRGEVLKQQHKPVLPEEYIAAAEESEEVEVTEKRVKIPSLPPKHRLHNQKEVELCISENAAKCEARRCMRCDLEFTEQPAEPQRENEVVTI